MYYWENRSEWPGSLNSLYALCGLSKQAFHGRIKRQVKRVKQEADLLNMIHRIRFDHPTLCCRMMYHMIQPEGYGRDRFEALCRDHGLMNDRRRSGRRTTDSKGVRRFDNLLEGLELVRVDQAWSSDITYYDLGGRFYYLTFIMDCYSRYILGYSVSTCLSTQHTTLPALHMALETRDRLLPPGLIFHSDAGGQYYDKEFLALTELYQIRNSMCEMAYDNNKAERLNGVIKNNYLKHRSIECFEDLVKEAGRAVHLYNTEKPHSSLDKITPREFEQMRCTLAVHNQPMMKESFEAKHQMNGASSPASSEHNQPQNQDVISANYVELLIE